MTKEEKRLLELLNSVSKEDLKEIKKSLNKESND